MATIVTFSVVGLAIWRGFRSVDSLVERWAKAHGLDLDEDARALVATRLRQGRRIRTVGFVASDVSSWVVLLLTGDALWFMRGVFLVHWWNIGGYFVAAMVAEVWFARSPTGSGVALLARRKLADYLPRPARFAPRLLAVVAGLLAATYGYVPYKPQTSSLGVAAAWHSLIPSAGIYRGRAAFVVGFVAAVEVIQRAVVRRRQEHTTEASIRADDSLRAWSIRILTGISIPVALATVGWTFLELLAKGGAVSFHAYSLFEVVWGYAAFLVALVSFRLLSRPLGPWRVPRVHAVQPA